MVDHAASVRRGSDGWILTMLGLVVALAGCGGGAGPDRPTALPPTSQKTPTAPVPPGETPAVTQQQLVRAILDGGSVQDAEPAWIAAVGRVDQWGGSFEFDSAGRLVGIDLASGRVTIMGEDLRQLPVFEHLVRLRVSSSGAGNAELAALTGMTELRELALRNTQIDADGLRQLSELKNLVSLDLQRSVNLRDDAFAALSAFPRLEELVLVEGVFTDAALDHLQPLAGLKRLDLRSCSGLTSAGLEKLARLGELRLLRVGGANIDDASMKLLAKITTLRSLTIEDASITDSGLASLVSLPLEDLSLARSFGITDEAFATIGQISGLRQLYLRDILISGAGLGQLAPLTQLSALRLRQTGVADAVLDDLAKLPALRRLELVQSWISDDGLASIGQLTGLNHLDLEDNRLSDVGVQHLERLIDLERLSLAQNEAITDAAFEVLERLPKLRELNVRGTALSRTAIDAFKSQRADVRVIQ